MGLVRVWEREKKEKEKKQQGGQVLGDDRQRNCARMKLILTQPSSRRAFHLINTYILLINTLTCY